MRAAEPRSIVLPVRLPLETAFIELLDQGVPSSTTPSPPPSSSSAPERLSDIGRLCARILVIDDDEPMGWVIRRALREQAEIVSETDPFEALRRLGADRKFDLVLCDVMMPGMTGIQLFDTLSWSRPDYVDRFAFMTSHGLAPAEETRLNAAGVPVLMKPFRTPQLRELVKSFTH